MHSSVCEEDACAALVEAALPGARIEACEPLTGGVSATVSRLDLTLADGSALRCVLREHGKRQCAAPHSHRPTLEFDLLEALHDYGLPVPRPIAFAEGGVERGGESDQQDFGARETPFVLCQYVEGETGIRAALAERQIETMAWQLAAIHAAPTDTLPDLPLRIDPQAGLLEFLPRAVVWTRLRAQIEKLGPQPYCGEPCLLHGDYWPANIVWREDRIAAVLDWEDAALGDPLSDVACAQLELRYIFGPWGAARFGEAYAQHREVDPVRLAWWQAWVAAAGARSMGGWGLAADRLAAMRLVALDNVRKAARVFAP